MGGEGALPRFGPAAGPTVLAVDFPGAEGEVLGLDAQALSVFLTVAACLRAPRGRATPARLMRLLGLKRPRVVRALKTLMGAGLLTTLSPGPMRLILTPRGSDVMQRLADGSIVMRRCPHCGATHLCRPRPAQSPEGDRAGDVAGSNPGR